MKILWNLTRCAQILAVVLALFQYVYDYYLRIILIFPIMEDKRFLILYFSLQSPVHFAIPNLRSIFAMNANILQEKKRIHTTVKNVELAGIRWNSFAG